MIKQHFEQRKNIQAGIYTIVMAGLLFLILFVIAWKVPTIAKQQMDDGIEVNYGTGDEGIGDIAPMRLGSLGNTPLSNGQPQQVTTPTSSITPVTKAQVQHETSREDASAETVSNKKTIEPVTPKQPVPKAQMGQQHQNVDGGNNQDAFNKVRNQGIAGGKGDQGNPNGNTSSDNYTGNGGTGSSGVAITKGLSGRKITRLPVFEDNFNENAKIAIDVQVDETGRVTSAVFQPRGSTTGNNAMKAIAIRKAKELKFNSTENESVGTLVFHFRLKE